MSQQLSPQKVTRLVSLLLAGLSETAIARKLDISQSSVSLYATQFGAVVAQSGLEAAGREFNVADQVRALHNLGAELRKAVLTVEEASLGVKVYRKLQTLSVSDDNYPHLVAAATKMENEGYLHAAMRLSQLEKSTDMPYGQIIATLESAKRKLGETRDQLKAATAKLNRIGVVISTMEAKEKTASRELADHLARVGADMKMIEKVETLTLTIKKAGISDGELDKMIQRQQLLNEAGISLVTLTSIMGKVAVATSRDRGRQLLKMLSEYGGLAGALDEQRTRLDALTKKADGLEAKAREKAEIEGKISGLRIERVELERTVARLKEETRPLADLKNEVTLLRGRKAALEPEVAELDRQKQVLDGDIGIRQQEVVNLSEAEARHKALAVDTDAMQAKLAENQKLFKVLDAFVGVISATSMENLDAFAQVLPEIIAEARLKQESPKLLTDLVFGRLAGDVLKIHRCTSCGARFATDKPKKPYLEYTCPVCGSLSYLSVVEDETVILKSAVGLAQPQRAPVRGIPLARGLVAVPRKPPDVTPVP